MSTTGDATGGTTGLPPELSPRGTSGRPRAAASRRRGAGRRLARRVAVIASALVVLTSAAGYAVSQNYLGNVDQIDAFDGLVNRPAESSAPVQTILLAGVDSRGNLTPEQRRQLTTGNAQGRRSDTMILLSVSDSQKSITAVSLPRDSLVTIPAYTDDAGVRHAASKNKLNAAFAFGDAPLTIQTIEKATGLRIDHYVEVDLAGFVKLVDAIGGVEVCTPTAITDKDSGLNLPAGRSKLDGGQGLAFVRARHIYADQDLGRIRAQQRFVGSMIKKATSSGVLLNPVRLNRVLGSITEAVNTDMDKDQLVEQVRNLRDYKPGDVAFMTVPIANGNDYVDGVGSVVTWDKQQARALFTKLKNDVPLNEPSGSKLTVAPGRITLQVLNGAGIQGLAGGAADDLAGIGFGMADIAKNADVTGQTTTVVRYDPTQEAASRTVLAAIPGSTGEAVPGLGSTIEVVIGSSYDGVTKPAVKGSTPSSTPKARTAAENVCKE